MKRSILAVGAWSVGAGAQVPDAQRAAGEGMDGGAVAGAVIAHHALHGDAVAGVERDGAAQEPDRGRGLLVAENLHVGQAGGVVDADMHELPALRRAAPARATVGVLAVAA